MDLAAARRGKARGGVNATAEMGQGCSVENLATQISDKAPITPSTNGDRLMAKRIIIGSPLVTVIGVAVAGVAAALVARSAKHQQLAVAAVQRLGGEYTCDDDVRSGMASEVKWLLDGLIGRPAVSSISGVALGSSGLDPGSTEFSLSPCCRGVVDKDVCALLADLGGLRTLLLDNTAVADDGVIELSRSQSIEVLDLEGTNCTGAVAEPLSRMAQLRRLILVGTRLSKSDVGRIRAILPKCEVVF